MRVLRVLAVLLLASGAAVPANGQDRRVTRLREYFTAAANLGQFNGSVLIAERGKVLADTAYGFADMELGVRNTPDTRFRVASVTKQFTAMAIVMLAEDGKLNIADPISKYLDSLPPSWAGITIHQVLRHTSGISDYEEWFDGYTTQAYSDYMSQAHAPARILRDAKSRPLDHEPGSKFRYSNSAYIILGFIIERAAGMPYADFLRTRIHQPLGMTLSDQDRSDEIIANRAQGYRLRPAAYPRAYFNGLGRRDYLNAVYQLMEPPQADAGLITTARDLYRWDQALYTERLVKRTSIDSIFTPGIGDYGYGWFVRSGPDGITHDHSGGLPGFSCYIRRIPGTHRTIIILGNFERPARTIIGDVAGILRGDSVAVPRARSIIASDSARNADFTGMYRTAAGDSVRVFIEGPSFGVHQPGEFRAALLPESAQDYFVVQLNGTARFRERDGRTMLVIEDALGREMVRAVRDPSAPGSAVMDTMPAAVVQRFVDAANARDAKAMGALVAPEAVFARFPDGRVLAQGRDSIHAFYARRLPPLSPGFRITVQPRIVERHLVIDQEHFTGTPAEQGQATWMYEVYGGLIRRAWALNGRPAAAP